jgi:hypothetical protein
MFCDSKKPFDIIIHMDKMYSNSFYSKDNAHTLYPSSVSILIRFLNSALLFPIITIYCNKL